VAGPLTAGPFQRLTQYTVTDPQRLRDELETVRHCGYAVAVDELEIGLTAVAAPIRSAQGLVVASLSASGPTARITPELVPVIAAQVTGAADHISRRLGWYPDPAR
jgi:DNA-binding IclR family transcriptional regulator